MGMQSMQGRVSSRLPCHPTLVPPQARPPSIRAQAHRPQAGRDGELETTQSAAPGGRRSQSPQQVAHSRHQLDAPDADLLLVLELATDEELDEIDRLLNGAWVWG